ncbi:PHP domain-containing protein [soil metagenome]
MKFAKADLHTHSTASDGLDSPASLVNLARERGISVLALTDHDTIGGIAEAISAARESSLRLIPGVEFSIRVRRGETHILGYGIDIADGALTAELERLRASREERGVAILERLDELGIEIPADALGGEREDQSPGRPHIARAMIDAGVVSSVDEAFDSHLGFGRPAFVPRRTITAERAIEVIHGAGGLAVLAHPLSVYDLEQALPMLIAAGLDGLEAYYGEYDQRQRESLANLATTFKMLMTGGSDFHGDRETPGRDLGSVQWPGAALEAILERLK